MLFNSEYPIHLNVWRVYQLQIHLKMSQEYMAGQVVSKSSNDTAGNEANLANLQEAQAESFTNQTAQQLSGRQNDTTQVGGSDNAQAEQLLLSKQRELNEAARRGDGLNVERLEAEVFNLAAQIVGGPNQGVRQEPEKKAEQIGSAEAIKSEYGEQQVNETLAWAGSNLSEEVSIALNEQLAADDADSYITYSALDHLKKNPDFISSSEENIPFDPAVSNQLQESYGELGVQLAAINAALCAGQCTRAHAAKLVMGNPKLAQVAFAACKSNLITLGL